MKHPGFHLKYKAFKKWANTAAADHYPYVDLSATMTIMWTITGRNTSFNNKQTNTEL